MTFACGLDLLLLIPIVIFCIILAAIVVVVLLVLAAVVIYIVLEMLSILIVLGYVAAIPIVFFLTCLVVPFVLAVGVPVLGPLALFVAPKLTIIDYLVSGVCSGFSCIKGLIGDRSCCKNETVNVNIDQPSPSRRRR